MLRLHSKMGPSQWFQGREQEEEEGCPRPHKESVSGRVPKTHTHLPHAGPRSPAPSPPHRSAKAWHTGRELWRALGPSPPRKTLRIRSKLPVSLGGGGGGGAGPPPGGAGLAAPAVIRLMVTELPGSRGRQVAARPHTSQIHARHGRVRKPWDWKPNARMTVVRRAMRSPGTGHLTRRMTDLWRSTRNRGIIKPLRS